MKITVTNQNIPMVVGMLKKAIGNRGISTQNLYPTNTRLNNIGKSMGLEMNKVEKSMIDVFETPVFEIDKYAFEDRKYIRVHNNTDVFSQSLYSDYRAFLIEKGDVIEFKNDKITIRQRFITFWNREKINHIIKILN